MKKLILLILLSTQSFLLSAQCLEEVETLGLFQTPPQQGLYGAFIIPAQYKTISINTPKIPDDTILTYTLHFSAAVYDTIGWDTILVFTKYSYYRLKANEKKDTSELIFRKNGKKYHISPPVFTTIRKWQNLVNPYFAWVEDKTFAPDAFVLNLKEISPRKRFIYKELKTPAQMHIQEGRKDTTFLLFPPSPYLEEKIIPAQYVYMPKLQKMKQARIDTIWKKEFVKREMNINEKDKRILVKTTHLGEFSRVTNFCEGAGGSQKVILIQKALKEKGFYKGEINHIFDKETQNAMIKFQQAFNLPVGKVDRDTLEELGIYDVLHN